MTRGRKPLGIPEERICCACGEMKPISEFYIKKTKKGTPRPSSYCIICLSEKNKEYARDKRGTSGWNDIDKNPGEYNDNEEKEQTHQLLKLIGWKFDKEKNMFYKPGLKEKDGTWTIFKKHQPKPIELNIPTHTPGKPLSKEMREKIKELIFEGYDKNEIATTTNVSVSMVYSINRTLPKEKRKQWK